MTIPKWLLPVLSVVAALAVGVATTLIGMRFASTDVQSSPSKTVTAPLYAPVADGQKDSAQIGTQTGTLPGTSGSPISGSRQQLINDVLHASDPGATIRERTTGSSSDGSDTPAPATSPAPAGDDCSPTSGEPPAGCPDGIHGAIFASHMIPPYWMNVLAFPRASGVASSTPRCAADATPGHVTIGVASDMPADFTVTYWPTGDTADREVVPFSTDATQVAAFNAYYGGTGTGPSPVMYTCHVLTVTVGTGYTAQVGATDSIGRLATPVTLVFNGGGAPLHPELEAYTVGDNLLFASALHAPDETVEIKAVQRTTAAADCNGSNAFNLYSRADSATVTVDYLNDHQLLPADTHRATYAFMVPEGTDFILCARWFTAGTAPSWQRTTPLYESRQSMSSPDTLQPTVSLVSVDPAEGTGTVAISMNTSGGAICGPNYTWNRTAGSTGGLTLPVDLCSVGTFGGARSNSDLSRFWDLGTDDMVHYQFDISSTNGLSGGTADGYFQLHVPCVGECRVPADERYHLSLLDGDTRATDGHIDLVVHYTEGNNNGAAAWVIGSVQGLAPTYTPPVAPAFDTDASVVPGPVIVGSLSSTATLHITSDRPVTYSVDVYEADGVGTTTCLRPGATYPVTGHLAAPGDVYLPDLCLGTFYGVDVTLTDAQGHRSVWGSRGIDPNGWWPGGDVFFTPSYHGTIRYDFRAYGPGGVIKNIDVSVAGATIVGPRGALNNSCRGDGLFNQQTPPASVALPEQIFVEVKYTIESRYTTSTATSDCRPYRTGDRYQVVDDLVPLQLTQLSGVLDGALISSAAGSPDSWTLHIWFDGSPTP
jgi:hypothetical protein